MLPLSFDRVTNGRSITSSLPIFQLPIELISHITPYLSPTDLASLALVDRDCRQLARSIQFCEVRMGASDASLEFLNLLEAEVRDKKNATSPGFTIGSCVRRVSICYDQTARSSHFGTRLDDLMFLSPASRRSRLSKEEKFEREYLDRACAVIRDALPNLYHLDWDTSATMSSEMIRCFTSTPVKHLRLENAHLNDVFTVHAIGNARFWALESLVLNVTWPLDKESNEDSAPFITSMLYQAAPTLTNLVWKGKIDQGYAHSFSEPPPRFPNLRILALESVQIDQKMLSALLGSQSGVASLAIDIPYQETSSFLKSRGCLPSLTHVHWITGSSENHSSMMSFIAENTQLQSLTTSGALPSVILDNYLLPLLSSFRGLTALRLAWIEDHISSESLQLIGSIDTLKHLWLSAGQQSGWRHTWQVNHIDLAEALSPLTSLMTLCFSRETYATDVHPMLDPSPEAYYINRNLPQAADATQYLSPNDRALLDGVHTSLEETFDSRGRILRRAWEGWHREYMAVFAAHYASKLPQLELCYLGQIPLGVKCCCGAMEVAPMMKDRDYSSLQLRRLWEQIL